MGRFVGVLEQLLLVVTAMCKSVQRGSKLQRAAGGDPTRSSQFGFWRQVYIFGIAVAFCALLESREMYAAIHC